MKLKLTSLIIALTITFTYWGCTHKCCVLEPQNVMFAFKNDKEWGAGASLAKVNIGTDSIFVIGQTDLENITIKLKKVNNIYTLASAEYYVTAGHDTPVRRYTLDLTQSNTVTINVDNGQHIEGVFNLNFTQYFTNQAGTYPTIVSFKNGNFRASWQ